MTATSAGEHVNVFAGLLLERNAERRDDAVWRATQLDDAGTRYLFLDRGGRAMSLAGALRLLDADERHTLAHDLPATYLGTDAKGPLFFCVGDDETGASIAASLDADFTDLRGAGTGFAAFDAGAFAFARALSWWQTRTRFCCVCGHALELQAFGHRARCTDPACATDHFPRVDPAMIVIVTWQDRCLLGRQSSWAPNRYSTLAGFVEVGESLEDAVRREVFEEAGVRVGRCSYHSSQPWPFPSSLMVGFTAEALDPAITVGPELSEARWFGVDDLVAGLADRSIVLPPRVSVSHELIAHWLRETGAVELASLQAEDAWQPAKS